MAKHRSHAKKHVSSHAHSRQPAARRSSSHILPFTSAGMPELEKNVPSFLSWPSYLFEMFMNPWRSFAPMASWMSANSNLPFPKTESHETDKAYIYTAELPGVKAGEISLIFQNGSLMLKIEQSEDRREKGRSFRHSRSVRRSFPLPVYTDAEKISAKLKGGVLTITIPKAPKQIPPRSHTIDIS